jgi:hypothetical protein
MDSSNPFVSIICFPANSPADIQWEGIVLQLWLMCPSLDLSPALTPQIQYKFQMTLMKISDEHTQNTPSLMWPWVIDLTGYDNSYHLLTFMATSWISRTNSKIMTVYFLRWWPKHHCTWVISGHMPLQCLISHWHMKQSHWGTAWFRVNLARPVPQLSISVVLGKITFHNVSKLVKWECYVII